MQGLLDKVRCLLGLGTIDPGIVTNKRERGGEDDYSDDEAPSLKRLKHLNSTRFPRFMEEQDERDESTSRVRLVPIQVEGRPSTSTPYDGVSRPAVRSRTSHLYSLSDVDPRRPRNLTPKLVSHHSADDDPEITWIEPKENNCKSNQSKPDMYVLVDEDDDEVQDENDSDVIYVERVVRPKHKYFVSKNQESSPARSPRYQLCRKYQEHREPSPRAKFKSPAGVTKVYRPKPTPHVAKWLNPIRTSTLGQIPLRKRFSEMNGNTRTAIKEAFNLEEKQNYRDLIRQMERSELKAVTPQKSKTIEVIDLDDKYSPIVNPHTQKRRPERLNLSASRISAEKDKDNEINLITSASLTSSDSEVEIVNSSNASTSSSVRIQPINTLRTTMDTHTVTKPVWVNSISNKHQKKIEEKSKKGCDISRRLQLIGEINREQFVEQMRKQLKDSLKLTDFEELEEEPVVEIPQLTPEQEKLVDRALGPGPSGQVFIEKFNLKIHRRDLQTLAGLNWLNDEVINFYMNLITQRSEERTDLPKVYTANTFFYPKLIQSGQAGLRRWTRKVDIFAHQLMVIPVHLGVHWCLCLVELDKKRVLYLDSMGGANQRCLDAVLQYLRDEHQDKKGQPFDHSGWRKEHLKDIPQQMNGSDCGMFACTFAEYASRRAAFTFTQSDMPRLRRKLCYEIIQGKLML